jgi:hypothetical protein
MYNGSRAISESKNDPVSYIRTKWAQEVEHSMEHVQITEHEDRDGDGDKGASENTAPKNPGLAAATALSTAAAFMNSSLFSGAPRDDPRQGLEH